MKLKAVDATQNTFERYGKVFKIPEENPTAQAMGFTFWSDVTNYHIQGETEIGWCTVYKQATTQIAEVERHLRTPEILIPLDAPFILPVLLEGDSDDQVQAFKVNVGEAIIIGDGVWHSACVPVGKTTSSYFVIFRRKTSQEDVIKKTIRPVTIEE